MVGRDVRNGMLRKEMRVDWRNVTDIFREEWVKIGKEEWFEV